VNKFIRILAGGTFFHVRPHLSLAAPAFGTVGADLYGWCKKLIPEMDHQLMYTRMADSESRIETNEDVSKLLDEWIADPQTKIIFFPVALCDFEAGVMSDDGRIITQSGKDQPRLKSNEWFDIRLTPAQKIISKIRKERKDIFLVGFKTTAGASEQEQFTAGLNLCKKSSCNLVLANDIHTRTNMIITPEEAAYHVTKDRQEALQNLVEMAKLRSHLTFTRSTVVAGESVPWTSELVPSSLRKVVNYCIAQGAYKPFNGATVGHFAVKVNDTTFLTSKRKTNFNDLDKIGLVRVETNGPDTVLAYGAKPSVGGQSQRIIFRDHPGMDCVVHFHCPLKPGRTIPIRSQREFECGSMACGKNASDGMEAFGPLKAVMLDQHGPNIIFHKNIDPQEVISFIEENFDLKGKTGGYMV
jgi:hypothetical protein